MFLLFSDEPVIESYSVLGFPLGWSTRRSGKCMNPSHLLFLSLSQTSIPHDHSLCSFFSYFLASCVFAVDSFCKTCYRRFDVPHPGIQKIFACGHKNVEKVCEMCYLRSRVLHPPPGEFAFGYHHPYHPYPSKHR
jgi:hypothetical protein